MCDHMINDVIFIHQPPQIASHVANMTSTQNEATFTWPSNKIVYLVLRILKLHSKVPVCLFI